MHCDRYRMHLLQLDLDPAAEGASQDALVEHLQACADCREWRRASGEVDARLKSASKSTSPDFVPAVLAAWRVEDKRAATWSFGIARMALLLAGVLQAVIGVDSMLFGHSHGAGDSGAFVAAIGIGFVVTALQPKARFAGLLPVALAASGLMLLHIARDVMDGSVAALDESYHGPTLLGVIVLLALRVLDMKYPSFAQGPRGQRG